MASKKPKLILQTMLAVLSLSFAVASCGGGGEKKETTDSTTMKSDSMSTMPMDTTKMDTASTRQPVKDGTAPNQ